MSPPRRPIHNLILHPQIPIQEKHSKRTDEGEETDDGGDPESPGEGMEVGGDDVSGGLACELGEVRYAPEWWVGKYDVEGSIRVRVSKYAPNSSDRKSKPTTGREIRGEYPMLGVIKGTVADGGQDFTDDEKRVRV